MANKYRGEIEALLDGKRYTLCLTLGALADLESAFGADDMLGLATRFESGRISSRDCVRIIGAGLRGGGNSIDDDTLLSMRADNGAAGFVDIVARLLSATFGGTSAKSSTSKGGEPGPFPGTT
jgi:Phage tail tube protein, GTA-gp10